MLKSQIGKFLVVGVVNTLFYYLLYSFFIFIGVDYKLAVLFATSIGVFFSFKTFSKYVFDNQNNKLIFKFIISYIILYFMNIYLIEVFIYFNKYIAGLIALIPYNEPHKSNH